MMNRKNPRYVEISKLGEGSFGCVMKARDTSTGKLVALKSITLKRYGDDRDRDRHKKGNEQVYSYHLMI
jgi:serine/threonine protein kinase